MIRLIRIFPLVLLLLGASGCENLLKRKISSDESLIDLAREELLLVRNGLGMYQAENDTSAYPGAADISSHQRLIDVLSPYVRLPERTDCAFTYVSYARAREDTFVLWVKARDADRTVISVTPAGLFLRGGKESIPLPP